MTEKTPAVSGNRQRETRTVVENRQARHLYFIEDEFEAGLKLEGWEVKSALAGLATFNSGSAYVKLRDGQAFLESLTITALPHTKMGLLTEPNPLRPRLLLLNKSELRKLERRCSERGYTVVPLSITYNGKLKLRIGLAKGKKLHDKKEAVKQRDNAKDLARELKCV